MHRTSGPAQRKLWGSGASAVAMALIMTVGGLGSDPVLAATESAASAQSQGLTSDLLVRLNRLSDYQIAPDGKRAIYHLRKTDMTANRGVTEVYSLDLTRKGAKPEKLDLGGAASSVRFAPDGQSLYFLSARGGSTQVWQADRDGRNPRAVTNTPLDIDAFRVGKTGLVIAVAMRPDCGGDMACTVAKQAEAKANPASGVLYDKIFVRHWDTWADGTRNHLFFVPINGGQVGAPVALTPGLDGDVPSKPFGGEEDFTLTPDGQSVIYSVRIAGKSEPWSTNFDLYQVPVTGGAAQNLTQDNLAWDAGPVVSPDGTQLAYRAMKRPGFEADRFGLYIRDLKTGAVRAVAQNWDRSADSITWSEDGRSLYVAAGDTATTRLFRVDLKTDTVTPLTTGGHVTSVAIKGQSAFFLRDSLSKPNDLYRLDLKARKPGAPEALTAVNAELLAGVTTGAVESFTFKGWNDATVHGYLVKPVGLKPGQTYPIAFLIHGGPQGTWQDAFSFRWNPQTYAAKGYGVILIDFHGSTGYGQAFTDAISGHWGDRPLEDLQKGYAAALAKYDFLDKDRACALGASYGGYMVNWIAGTWNEPWKCLVNHNGILDTRTMGFSTEELWFTEWENNAVLAENPAAYDAFNPLLHVPKWRVPMMVVQGQKDYRVPVEQGLGTFSVLQRKGIPSQLLYYPDENHWVLKPQNSLQWHKTVESWLDRWTAQPAAK